MWHLLTTLNCRHLKPILPILINLDRVEEERHETAFAPERQIQVTFLA